jgi:hypothetical protein
MKIRLLRGPRCDAAKPTKDLLLKILEREGLSSSFEEVIIADAKQAAREGMLGSPSIQIDGLDIEEAARSRPPSFT